MTDQAYRYNQQQASAPTPVREYEIIVRQEPKQARMCGIGGKADRRPIDPPPIVQLRVYDRYPTDPSNPNASSSNHQYHPHQPQQALNFLQNPYYFMFASLARVESDDELHLLNDGKTRYTTGSVVSSLYHLKDTENGGEDAGFFIFPDLSVRTEGSYRLKLALFELVGSHVQFCKSVYSRAFYVYTAKKFPGMEESTRLSMSLSDQGIKIRIRKDVRSRKRNQDDLARENAEGNGGGGDDDEEEDEGEYGRDDGVTATGMHPHAASASATAEGTRLAITGGSANDATTTTTTTTGNKGGGRAPAAGRRKASTGGARFAADIVPKGNTRPTKRQRTQGGTVIDLSHNNVPLPPAVAVAASMSPSKRLLGGATEGGNDKLLLDGPQSSSLPPTSSLGGGGGGPKWDHLPEPTIKGGVPIDVEEHPATKLDPRLKHTLPSGSTTPPGGGGGGSSSKATNDTAAGQKSENPASGLPPGLPSAGPSAPASTASSGRTVVPRHARSASLNQAGAPPPLQLQVSGPNPSRGLAQQQQQQQQHHHHQHSSSHGSTPSDAYPGSSWATAAAQFSPIQAQAHGQPLQGSMGHVQPGGPGGGAGGPHQVTTGYHPSAASRTSAPMSAGPGGGGGMGGMALPPLQIPQQQPVSAGPGGPRQQVPMGMHSMTPIQPPHGYGPGPGGYASNGGDLTASPELMHPSMTMGPPPPPSASHGHGPAGYGEPSVRQSMMLSAGHQPYMSPDGPPGPVYSSHGHAPMSMPAHMQGYPAAHHHTYSHPHSHAQQGPQAHAMSQQGPRPSPTSYVHHAHHLSDPHIHAHTHTYEAYGAAPGGSAGGAGAPDASPAMIAMGLSPISPARATPLSAHPPSQQQQQEMYPGSAGGVGRDPYGAAGYPPRHAPPQQQQQQQQQLSAYGEQRHVQGGPAYGEVGPPMYAHGHAPSNPGYPHPHGERGWGQEEE